ncbi:MAG: hypothetical protein IJX13_06940 [Clostridia bacterium]|nr:hypothetical protein [Clostridia bacterium]
MVNESSIKEIIRSSLDQVRTVIDADTVVGKQILTPSGTVIIPISKVSMGFASGGLDLPVKNEEGTKNFGGGGGTGVTVTPVGFLTVSPEGEVDMIPMTAERLTPVEQVAELVYNAPDLIERIKNVFFKSEADKSAEEEKVVSELEEAYCQKMAQEEAKDAELAIEEVEAIPEELSKEDKKRLKKEAKERKKLEKKGVVVTETVVSADEVPAVQKKGKISEKTLESGTIR